MPSARVRFPVEAAFLVLVVLGAVLAGLALLVIVVLAVVAVALVAVVERAFAREARRSTEEAPPDEEAPEVDDVPQQREVVDVEPAPEPEPEPEPELAVSERSARAILAAGPPPVQEASVRAREPAPQLEREPEPQLEPEPEPEPQPAPSGTPQEWNIWDLEVLVRDRPDDPRHEEWTALILSLRDFATADGALPLEFDELVRESFGGLLAGEARTEVAAAQ